MSSNFAAGVVQTSLAVFAFWFVLAGLLWTPALVGLAALYAIVAVGAATAGAQAPPETFAESVNVELINVEVWVTDGEGNAVTGLTVEDFEVREDGRAVTISYFDELRGVGVGVKAGGARGQDQRVDAVVAVPSIRQVGGFFDQLGG